MPNNKFFLNIPEIKTAGLISYQILKTGLSNQSYKLETQDGIWIIRINNKQLQGVDRLIEAETLKLIKPLDISPEVICNNPAGGYLITRFINEPVWTMTDCQNPKLQQKLFEIMEQVHAIKYQNPKTHLKKRLALYLTNSTLKHNEQFMQKYNQCMEQLQQSNFWQQQNQLIHYDLNPNNIIGHKNPKIIDWEF
ncbi:MAG: phosphotransferase, partial [Proteobacteria bacterium]|nr:phosphotransferase [Pseudomonadota bacterium]